MWLRLKWIYKYGSLSFVFYKEWYLKVLIHLWVLFISTKTRALFEIKMQEAVKRLGVKTQVENVGHLSLCKKMTWCSGLFWFICCASSSEPTERQQKKNMSASCVFSAVIFTTLANGITSGVWQMVLIHTASLRGTEESLNYILRARSKLAFPLVACMSNSV